MVKKNILRVNRNKLRVGRKYKIRIYMTVFFIVYDWVRDLDCVMNQVETLLSHTSFSKKGNGFKIEVGS